MKCELNPRVSSGDWKEFCSRFHFPLEELPNIQAIYKALLPLMESYAYYSLNQDLKEVSFSHYAYGFVTLGNGMDELSELYLNHEQIQEAYIVDCISLMLLSKAYEEFAHVVEEQSGLYLTELSFLGDTYSMDLLPQIYEHLAPDTIQLTEGRCFARLRQQHSSCIWIQKYMRMSNNYVIPAKIARIFPARPERLRLRHCHTPMVLCRFFM